ncbi:MAG TPA: DUF305 domain-containing protein [Patescibacteria group bacterium]|nr:DUF305 domain-containing protein [Patescibacteria group bacterium]
MRKFLIPIILVVTIGLLFYMFGRPKDITPTPSSMVHSFTITDEKTFLENMIPHHQEAVDTSTVILSQTQDSELKQFTQGVVGTQTKEIVQMKEWLLSWYLVEYTPNSNYEPMMANLTEFKNKEQERVYVEGMVRHHQGAIEMAKKILTLNPRIEVKQIAQDIISAQESEIILLQGWLVSKYSEVKGEDKATHDIQIH